MIDGVRVWFKMLDGIDRIALLPLHKEMIDMELPRRHDPNTVFKYIGLTRSGARKYAECLKDKPQLP